MLLLWPDYRVPVTFCYEYNYNMFQVLPVGFSSSNPLTINGSVVEGPSQTAISGSQWFLSEILSYVLG